MHMQVFAKELSLSFLKLVRLVCSEAKNYVRSQTMLAAATFMIAAKGAGLDTCPMEGFDEHRIKKLLAIPAHMSVPVIVAVGYPLNPEEQNEKPQSYRFPLREKLSVDVFTNRLKG